MTEISANYLLMKSIRLMTSCYIETTVVGSYGWGPEDRRINVSKIRLCINPLPPPKKKKVARIFGTENIRVKALPTNGREDRRRVTKNEAVSVSKIKF
jgi:hypothetical protein